MLGAVSLSPGRVLKKGVGHFTKKFWDFFLCVKKYTKFSFKNSNHVQDVPSMKSNTFSRPIKGQLEYRHYKKGGFLLYTEQRHYNSICVILCCCCFGGGLVWVEQLVQYIMLNNSSLGSEETVTDNSLCGLSFWLCKRSVQWLKTLVLVL